MIIIYSKKIVVFCIVYYKICVKLQQNLNLLINSKKTSLHHLFSKFFFVNNRVAEFIAQSEFVFIFNSFFKGKLLQIITNPDRHTKVFKVYLNY